MFNSIIIMLTLMLIAFNATAISTSARGVIRIVGSSTVYPFMTTVAENFSNKSRFKTPVVEATGTGGGMKVFCSGIGPKQVDVTYASRKIKNSEIALCNSNGVEDILEIQLGFGGIVVANSNDGIDLDVSVRELFLALVAYIPDEEVPNKWNKNQYTHWDQINPEFPNIKIRVLGPPPTSGTRDAFVEIVMEQGCSDTKWVHELITTNKVEFKKHCHKIRQDGHYVTAGENDNLIIKKLKNEINTFGIFGFSFLDNNMDVIKGISVDGVKPEFGNILHGSYPISRSLFVYIKVQHINYVPGIKEFIYELISDSTLGEDGYLTDRGLIPLTEDKINTQKDRVFTFIKEYERHY